MTRITILMVSGWIFLTTVGLPLEVMAQSKFPTDWGDWSTTDCFSRLDIRVRIYSHNETDGKYTWEVQFRNRYPEAINFSYAAYDALPPNPISVWRPNLKAGETETAPHYRHNNSDFIWVYVDRVTFGDRDAGESTSCDIGSSGRRSGTAKSSISGGGGDTGGTGSGTGGGTSGGGTSGGGTGGGLVLPPRSQQSPHPPELFILSHAAQGTSACGERVIAVWGVAYSPSSVPRQGGGYVGVGIVSVTVNGGRADGDTARSGYYPATSPSLHVAYWGKQVTLTEGRNVITVVARDGLGRETTKTVTVIHDPVADSKPPTLTVTSHTGDNIALSGAQRTVRLKGTATDFRSGNSGIAAVTVNGIVAKSLLDWRAKLNPGDNRPTWNPLYFPDRPHYGSSSCAGTTEWEMMVEMNAGTNRFEIVAHDDSPDSNTTAKTLIFTLPPDSPPAGKPTGFAPPTLTVTSHRNGDTVSISRVTLRGAASPETIDITVAINGVRIAGCRVYGEMCLSKPTGWVNDVVLSPGTNCFRVVATDSGGRMATIALALHLTGEGVAMSNSGCGGSGGGSTGSGGGSPAADSAPPLLTVLSHRDGQTVATDIIVLLGLATDKDSGGSGISSVTVNGSKATLGEPDANGRVNWNQRVTLTSGTNRFTIVARDASPRQNARTTSLSITFVPPITNNRSYSNSRSVSLGTNGNASSAGSLDVGYAKIRASSGQAPAGLAIFSYQSGGVVVSEATVPASPLIREGRIYTENGRGVDTGIAIANPNDQPATVNFYFTNDGIDVGASSVTVPTNGQIANFLSQPPFNSPTGPGTFSFNSTVPVSVIALRGLTNERGEFLITTLPVLDTSAPGSSQDAVLPHFASGGGWATEIVLINPGDSTLDGRILIGDKDGQLLSIPSNVGTHNNFRYSIKARSALTLVTAASGGTIYTGSVHVDPDSGHNTPVPLAVFSYRQGSVTVTEAGVPSVMGRSFRMYVESRRHNGAGDIQAGVAIANNSNSEAIVNLAVGSGSNRRATTLRIPEYGQVVGFLDQLMTTLRGMSVADPMEITSNVEIAVVGLRGRQNERGEFLITTTPPSPQTAAPDGQMYLFPHIANGGGYTTQFIVFDRGGRATSGSLEFVRQSGAPMNLRVDPR